MATWGPKVVVVGVDGSEQSKHAAAVAADLVRCHGARLHIVTVVRPPEGWWGIVGSPPPADSIASSMSEAQRGILDLTIEGVDLEELEGRIAKLTAERDEWEGKIEKLRGERDDLLAKLEEKPEEKIVYKYVKDGEEVGAPEGVSDAPVQQMPIVPGGVPGGVDEESYWAEVLKQKVALGLELENLKTDLTESAVEVVELKKQNSDLQLELSKLANEKETIEREIKYTQS